MRERSLRQLAKELGVSASYLSQVKNGKKKPSGDLLTKVSVEALTKHKVLTKMVNTDHQTDVDFGVRRLYNFKCNAEVAQSVEQRTENPRVPSSILGLGTTGRK